jgi:hypothetical protein
MHSHARLAGRHLVVAGLHRRCGHGPIGHLHAGLGLPPWLAPAARGARRRRRPPHQVLIDGGPQTRVHLPAAGPGPLQPRRRLLHGWRPVVAHGQWSRRRAHGGSVWMRPVHPAVQTSGSACSLLGWPYLVALAPAYPPTVQASSVVREYMTAWPERGLAREVVLSCGWNRHLQRKGSCGGRPCRVVQLPIDQPGRGPCGLPLSIKTHRQLFSTARCCACPPPAHHAWWPVVMTGEGARPMHAVKKKVRGRNTGRAGGCARAAGSCARNRPASAPSHTSSRRANANDREHVLNRHV